ncbi:pyridoxamine 5'-phosphate oxidase [Acuticoccus sp. MNP-M23]|uniref:pyridoxamine 5'-phosphate oxidase n=1 Tax=Acuticoccus sp. MNP-M23 TaxID=3072793 RepID=UPI002814CE4C|nr:pyridoxamine 5'-phosphate oxidase [Acuticoccus sp. MNP-M23]WMS41483.1 pyridoxamine 5'-phosphate oxidase [Acuticoccus sp. MNP-M23]
MNATLDDTTLKSGQAPDPFALFTAWLEEAAATEPNDANAMALATADASGLPDVRMVLLKGHDASGFVFYTNLESAKGVELAVNPQAALLFHWKSLRRQVRVRGEVSPVSAEEADAYFASRPRGSRIGAWASDQSRPAPDRAELERRVTERDAAYGDDVPRPPHWSGFRVVPSAIEFWKDGAYRLHDRFAFARDGAAGEWRVQRLFP